MSSELDRIRNAANVEISKNEADDDIFEQLLDEHQRLKSKKERQEIKEREKKRESKLDQKDKINENDGEESEDEIFSQFDSDEEEIDETHEIGVKEEGIRKERTKETEEVQEEQEIPSKEEIKKELIEKAALSSQYPDTTTIALSFLEDEEKGNVFIGRKKQHLQKYGYEGALYIGKVAESEHNGKNVYLDSLNPHVIFVCGARGSGKSYVLGVIAEELAKRNKNIGAVVIDPIGVFWSMKYPNRDERELKELPKWGLEPEGLENVKVFIPEGMKDKTPPNTYDATFSIRPSLLTAEDWALTFGIERFSPTGLLLEVVIKKVQNGYVKVDGTKVPPKKDNFSLNDIIECLDSDESLHSKDRGYKPDSLRALASRFEAAKSWGIFSAWGTPLTEISKEGQLTIIDTSFLEDSVAALVIGLIARRILAARKISTRKEAATEYKPKDATHLLELDIPPTWLFIDEAHTLIPSGNVKTAATDALVEYVKQGRRPGCSLVFATQQPSAIDTKILSQLDILIAHKLVFDDDIKAVYKRIPTIVPHRYKQSTFIKTLPIGTALVADRSELTSRAFIMKIRPRCSQHEGREAEVHERSYQLKPEEAKKLLLQVLVGKLESDGFLEFSTMRQLLDSLNTKYKTSVDAATMEKMLSKVDGVITLEDRFALESYLKSQEEEKNAAVKSLQKTEEKIYEPEKVSIWTEKTELLAMAARISEHDALAIANRIRKKRTLGLFGSEESIRSITQRYITIWKIKYDAFNTKHEFIQHECFIDSQTGEFIHFTKDGFVRSSGLQALSTLSTDAVKLLKLMLATKPTLETIIEQTGYNEAKIRRLLEELYKNGFVEKIVENEKVSFVLKKTIDLPVDEAHELLSTLNKISLIKMSAVPRDQEKVSRKQAIENLKQLWPNIIIREVTEIYRPIYEVVLAMPNGSTRVIKIDAITGLLI